MYSNWANLAFSYVLTNRIYDSSQWIPILSHPRELRLVDRMLYRASSTDLRIIRQGAAAKKVITTTGIPRATYFRRKKRPNPASEKRESAMHPGHSRGVWANLPYLLQAAGSIGDLIQELIQDKITKL